MFLEPPQKMGLKREMIDLKIQENQVPGGAQVIQEDHKKQQEELGQSYKKDVINKREERGAWVAKAVKHVTPDFRSGYDLWVLGSRPMSGSALSADSATGSPSLLLYPSPTRAISVSPKAK